ncbi:MAG: 1-deoxy-D-xylulose 5-phosphate reductoisomerase [Syntrophus sp. PtaU1.Bin005]|jgi:1-deoxy-D-xylulose-5-phosphate reductoisomerase|nr:MAG: 1-deoxy-D-xylulose 5-phosphate reductoisomerase [Syntrophus sp. PtaB.Bin138]OPY81828.1 MAG: 1-deoxy-D-xylulose 5-phosphate reductoisomerase [Syntrophus sp. PtaU1.Bin005]
MHSIKQISLLGSTGSIGRSSLDVIRRNPDRFKIIALAAGRNLSELKRQIEEFQPSAVSVIDEHHALELKRQLPSLAGLEVLYGSEGYRQVASLPDADLVISAMVGAAGLLPTLAAIEAGRDIALANKETLVMAGSLVLELAKSRGVNLLPVDSEHSAIFQCLSGQGSQRIRNIHLTASGGPFFRCSRERLETVGPKDALKHPNWLMGDKITIDSATMMNKGLEVIEAKWLFGVEVDQILVCIHPQSIVHSMVEFTDGSVLAQLGIPDMKIPIAYALSFPERMDCPELSLDLFKIGTLEFFPPDIEMFPCLGLAYKAAREGGTMPAVLNAANEVAVEAFLAERLPFMKIPRLVERVMDSHGIKGLPDLGDILEADAWARREAQKLLKNMRD